MFRPKTILDLFIGCSSLKNKDILSKSDPQVVVFLKGDQNPGVRKQDLPWIEIGRTEMLKDSLDPQFTTPIPVSYFFEETQPIRLAVYDVDNPRGTLDDQDFLGEVITTVATIVSAHQSTVNMQLTNSRSGSSLKSFMRISAVEMKEDDQLVTMSISGRDLDKKDFFGKSDPFFEIHRQQPNGTWLMVYRNNPIRKTLNPDWPSFELTQLRLTQTGDLNTPLLFRVFDWDESSDPDLIGEAKTSLAAMKSTNSNQMVLLHPKKSKSGKGSGTLVINQIKFEKMYTFLDYISNGTEMNLVVALDFTASNGDPKLQESLHFIGNPNEMNQYQKAIYATGTILEYYDKDKRFPVYGFGARFPNGIVSHMFPLTANANNPEVSGVQGILDVYRFALNNLAFYGPTNFSPTIQQVSKTLKASESNNSPGSNYTVLLILTDGEITDMQETIDSIVDTSTLPLSIVIVGVGNADFKKMDILDGDNGHLISSSGRLSQRDIVQFVPFRKFVYNGGFDEFMLAKEVLAEIPTQVVGYMRIKKISPRTL